MLVASAVLGLDAREDPYRVGVTQVGDPVLLTYEQLSNEMERNLDLDTWIKIYGRPDYAEAQRIEIDEPFYPYEIHLYYLDGNRYVVFGRVAVAPSISNYGVRKYVGRIDAAQLERLLTAEPMVPPVATYEQRPASESAMEEPEFFVEEVIAAPAADGAAAAEEIEVEIVAEPATAPADAAEAAAAEAEAD